MDNITPKISLSFTKTIEKKKLQSFALGTEKPETEKLQKEAITCFNKNIKRSEGQEESALIIPLIESKLETIHKNIKERVSSPSSVPIKVEKDEEMSIVERAAAAVIEESARKLEELNSSSSLQQQEVISVANVISNQDGEVSSIENYDQINIEHFGAAMLRGMGWKKGRGVGKNNKRVAMIIDPTNKGGLSLSVKKKKIEDNESQKDELEMLELKKGSHILIEDGRNRGSYGIVECVDEDHVLVRLSREEKIIRDVEQNIRVVSSKEYKEFSRVINKAMYDDYKAAETNRKKEGKKEKYLDNSKEKQRKKNRESYHFDKESSFKRKEEERDDKKREKNSKNYENMENKRRDKVDNNREEKDKGNYKLDWEYYKEKTQNKYENGKDSKEHKEKKKKQVDVSYNVKSIPSIPWAREDLRVRIIDRVFKGGKYHKEKVIIRSVDTIESCTCVTEEGKVLYDVNPNNLETVIPKKPLAVVLIVKGNYKGQKARILELHKEKEKATIQLLDESSVILKLYYDDICEYVSRENPP